MVSFTFNVKCRLSPAFAYEVLSSVAMIREVMPIGGVSRTITFRVMIGPGLPASSSGAV